MNLSSLGLYLLSLLLLAGSGLSQRRSAKNIQTSSSGNSASQVVDFDCPEEFGYYPHPADCTQYYVCVFGGALLESCTGGLMYSHELQTCDWPRNVGCGEIVSTVSTIKAEPRPRQPSQLRSSQQQQQQHQQQQQQQQQQRQQQQQQQQQQQHQHQQQPPPQRQQFPPQRPLQREEAIPKHHLYTEEDLGPAEEVESDRQQRVYRGQPATLGQVARDRDGLSRHSNALQVAPANGREKLSVISFGTQQQYSFPGDTKTLHPSTSAGATSWSAASIHFSLPLPPPPPSWPPFSQHYNHANANRQGLARFNIPPNRQITNPSQFSKQIRFPIQDNEDDFIPIIGQGVKLPKPAPELLITPSSINVNKQTQSHQRKEQQYTLTSLNQRGKQPDNYAFFNLESVPPLHSKDNTTRPTLDEHSSTFNGSFPTSSDLKSLDPSIIGVNTNKGRVSYENQTQTVKIPSAQVNHGTKSERNRSEMLKSPFVVRGTPNLNLISSASHSEETQVIPPASVLVKNYRNNKKEQDDSSSDYFQSQYNGNENYAKKRPSDDEDLSNTNDKSVAYNRATDNAKYNSNIHLDQEVNQTDKKTQEDADGSDYEQPTDESYSSSDQGNSHCPSPPKEFFEDPGKKYKNIHNPFADPEFDFDKYFYDISEHTTQRNAKPPTQQVKQSLEPNEQKSSVSIHVTKPRKPKPHQNQKSLRGKTHTNVRFDNDNDGTVLSGEQEENNSHQQERFPKVSGLIRTIRYQPVSQGLSQKVIVNKQKQGNKDDFESSTVNYQRPIRERYRPYTNKTYLLYDHHDTFKAGPRPPDAKYSVVLSHNSNDSDIDYPLADSIVKSSVVAPSSDIGSTEENLFSNESFSIPSNHKYDYELSVETATPFSFNFTDVLNNFVGTQKELIPTEDSFNATLKHDTSTQEPSLYTVHRQNSLSESPNQKYSNEKDDESAYDDEDYYGSAEDTDYYDEFSFENLQSPVNKKIKPPNVPKRLKNIDFMSFGKEQSDEDYDYASVEEEDDSERDNYSLQTPYTLDQITDCNRKYKNHKCNTSGIEENDYEDDRSGSEEYDYDEDEDDKRNKFPKRGQYEVTEDTAESQHSLIKSKLTNEQTKQIASKNNLHNHDKHLVLNNFNNSISSNKLSNNTVGNLSNITLNKKPNNSSDIPLITPNNTLGDKISHEILLEAVSADQGFVNHSLNLNTNKTLTLSNRYKLSPKSYGTTATHLQNSTAISNQGQTRKLDQSSEMTFDRTKLNYSSTSPLNPKPLKHLRQRPLTKPTNFTPATDFEPGQSVEQPMTLIKLDSQLTNSLTFSSRQSIAPPPYIEQTTTQRVTSRGYNATQQQYTPSPYDPYYNIYEDEADLYKDIDYSQYSGQQNQQYQAQPTYKEKQPQVVQQQVTPSRKPSVQYSPPPPPPPPPQPSYNAVQQDVYSQAQDYNDNYSLQDEDIDYKQSDIDLKGNRSRTTMHQQAVIPTNEAEKENEKQDQHNSSRTRHLTLTAAFSFDNVKSPVTSSKKIEENLRHRSSQNSFRVEEPPSSGPQRDTHELVLSYIRQENSGLNEKRRLPNGQVAGAQIKQNTGTVSGQTSVREILPKNDPKPFTYYLDDLDTSQISSTSPPKRDTKIQFNDESQSAISPFRIIVPSTTENPVDYSIADQLTLRPKYPTRRGNRQQLDSSENWTPSSATVRPYKLPTLSKETIGSITIQQTPSQPNQEPVQSPEKIQNNKKEVQIASRRRHQGDSYKHSEVVNLPSELDDGILRFIPITPQRSPPKSSIDSVSRAERFHSSVSSTVNSPNVGNVQAQPNTESEQYLKLKDETNLSDNPNVTHRRRYPSQLKESTPPSVTVTPPEESFVKLIPIKTVRNKLQYEANQNENLVTKIYQSELTTNTLPRKAKDRTYEVTENSSDFEVYSPSTFAGVKKHRPQLLEDKDVAKKVTSSNPRKSLFEGSYKKSSSDQLNIEEAVPRLFQTTETPVQKTLYSLRVASENKKYNSNVGDLVLATLETITQPPYKTDNNPNLYHINSSSSGSNTNQQVFTTESSLISNKRINNQHQDEQQSNINEGGSVFIDPVRIRSRARTSATNHNFSSRKEYNAHLPVVTSTENYANDQQTTVNRRTRIRPSQAEVQPSTEGTRFNDKELKRTTEEREYRKTTEKPTQIPHQDSNSYMQSNLKSQSSDLERSTRYNQKRRQLKSRNRLEPVTEEQDNDQLKEDDIFDSEEETILTSNKKTSIESDNNKSEVPETNHDDSALKFEDRFLPRRSQNWHTQSRINPAEPVTDENNEELLSENTEERQHNTIKMHTRKKLRVTTIQPVSTTESYDFDDSFFSKTRQDSPNLPSQDQPDSVQKPSFESFVDENRKTNKVNRLGDLATSRNKGSVDRVRDINYQSRESGARNKENQLLKATDLPLGVDPYSLLKSSPLFSDNLNTTVNHPFEQTTLQMPKYVISRHNGTETKPAVVTRPLSPIAMEVNSYFKEFSQNSTTASINTVSTRDSTTAQPMTTVERIRDKFRLGSFPKPTPSSNTYARKPSVEDNTPPPLPSDRCSQELDNESDCNDKPLLRVRPTPASPDSQSTPGLTRGSSRHRGSATYTVSPNEAEPSPTPNRGTPSTLSRNRPTLKPSTAIVSKAAEFVDIYRHPPSRPEPIYPTPQVDKTAAKCRKDVCLLPDCSCGGKEIPGDLLPEETPQIVLITFDDSVNDLNKGLYSDLFEKGRTNPNGCPIAATFYVSHEWTDYSQVQNLYSSGHEIASHSVSHSFGEQFSVKKWTREIAGQREILSAYGGVKQEDIRGMRAPFLAIGGNKMFKMLYDSNFTYDSSMPVYENKPPSWPYTLDYKLFHDCMIPPCPTRSYPGVWEVPMVMWQDLNGGRCSMGDACSNPPAADGVYKMLMKNFERHFTSNRSPFGLFYHAAWFTQPHHKEGFIAFLDAINKMPEVWLVTNWQAVQWVRDPTPISRLNNFAPFQCNYPERPRRCNNPKVCNLWHKSGVRYMRTCQPCPDIYPWTGKTGVRNSRVDNQIITE